jgi:hypothetical protein
MIGGCAATDPYLIEYNNWPWNAGFVLVLCWLCGNDLLIPLAGVLLFLEYYDHYYLGRESQYIGWFGYADLVSGYDPRGWHIVKDHETNYAVIDSGDRASI